VARTARKERIWVLQDVTTKEDGFFPRLSYASGVDMSVARAVLFNNVHFFYDDELSGPRTWARWTYWKWAELLYSRPTPTGPENCWFQCHPGLPMYFVDYEKPLILIGWFTHPDTNVPHAACYVPHNCQSTHLTKAKQTQIGNLLRFIPIGQVDLRVTFTWAKTWNNKRPEKIGHAPDTADMVRWMLDLMVEKDTSLPAGVKNGLKDLNLDYVPHNPVIIIHSVDEDKPNQSAGGTEKDTGDKRPHSEEAVQKDVTESKKKKKVIPNKPVV
jgi:hypothetical protein